MRIAHQPMNKEPQGLRSRWINHVWWRSWANFIPHWVVVRTEFALARHRRQEIGLLSRLRIKHLILIWSLSLRRRWVRRGPHKQKDGGLIRYWTGHVEHPHTGGGMPCAHGLPEATAEADQWRESPCQSWFTNKTLNATVRFTVVSLVPSPFGNGPLI